MSTKYMVLRNQADAALDAFSRGDDRLLVPPVSLSQRLRIDFTSSFLWYNKSVYAEIKVVFMNNILKNKLYLYMTEFFSGMAVMAVELAASRLMAPYFSSSQIVYTIIIGTVKN